MEKVLVIGSGPAGLTAALYSARANLSPLVIEGLEPGGQLTTTTEVENYPGFEDSIDGTELVMIMRKQAERFGVGYIKDEVVAVDFSRVPLNLKLSDGKILESQTIIIATGASALYLGLNSEKELIGRGVSACATCDGAFFRDMRVAVVGGGDTAMEEALFLTRMCSEVTIIHRRNNFRASKIMAQRVMNHEKIKIIWESNVIEIKDVGKGTVTAVVVKNLKSGDIMEIPIAGLFMGIGHRPNTVPFQGQIKMDENGYIVTDNTRTSVRGVFAAGDVQDHTYRQAVTAAGSGCMAALEAERYLEAQGQ